MDYNQRIIDEINADISTFPNTELFSIHWIGGSSGAFLRSLTQLYITVADHKSFIKNLSTYNNSHESVLPDGFNWHPDSFMTHQGYISWMPPRHRYVKPLNENLPVFVVDHIEAEYGNFWQRWPLGKILLVSVRSEDQYEIQFNMYWKAFVQYFDAKNPGNLEHWNVLKKDRHDIFEKYDHPADISNDDMLAYLFGSKNDFETVSRTPSPHEMQPFFSAKGNVPIGKEDKVLRVPYYNLVRTPEYTMELLSSFLGRPTSDGIKEFYYTYIERQNKLIAEHAPWFRDENKSWSIAP